MSSQVRVRFSPSPTGFFHIGSARTALFNWLYARHTGGVFILRIEDTDKERNREEYFGLIYDSLAWLGVDWDEGPDPAGGAPRGNFGPYLQSQRGAIYEQYKRRLLDTGRAYEKDGATWFKLLGDRYTVFDDHRKKEVEKVKCEPVVIDDLIRGRVERQEDEDFVIFRSDGSPIFHFANVVDDITMNVTHIIRGEDHLSNTSKHVRLYEGFGATPPAFAHIPLILKSPEMGQGKMSKRDKGALIEEYRQRHFLPEAVVNYLALLGWNPGDDREKLPIAEIIRLFDLPAVNQSNARFDAKKLEHMNMLYLQGMEEQTFADAAYNFYQSRLIRLETWIVDPSRPPKDRTVANRNIEHYRRALKDRDYFDTVMKLVHPKLQEIDQLGDNLIEMGFSEISVTLGYARYFFVADEDVKFDEKAKAKVLGKGDPKARLTELVAAIPSIDFSDDGTVEAGIRSLAESKSLGFGDYQAVARLAVTGTNVGPSITGIFRVLGKERVMARLNRFLVSF